MSVPFKVEQLPVVRGSEAIRAGLAELAMTDLPALVIEDNGQVIEDALATMEPLFPTGMVMPERGTTYVFSSKPGESPGFGYHVDAAPVGRRQKTIRLNFHHTEQGEVEGRFFRYTPTYLANPRRLWKARDKPKTSWVAYEASSYRQIDQGVVDPDQLLPICYRGISRAGTTTVFKEGEPLLHRFETLESPRYSRARIGQLAINPGLGLTRCSVRQRALESY